MSFLHPQLESESGSCRMLNLKNLNRTYSIIWCQHDLWAEAWRLVSLIRWLLKTTFWSTSAITNILLKVVSLLVSLKSSTLQQRVMFALKFSLSLCNFPPLNYVEQVVQYYSWKASEIEATKVELESSKILLLSESQQHRISDLKSSFLKEDSLVETVFGSAACGKSMQQCFDWTKFAAAITMWEGYARESYEEVLRSIPYWKMQQSIFIVSYDEK